MLILSSLFVPSFRMNKTDESLRKSRRNRSGIRLNLGILFEPIISNQFKQMKDESIQNESDLERC